MSSYPPPGTDVHVGTSPSPNTNAAFWNFAGMGAAEAIDHGGVIAAALFLVVYGIVTGSAAMWPVGLGILGIKLGSGAVGANDTRRADALPPTPPTPPA